MTLSFPWLIPSWEATRSRSHWGSAETMTIPGGWKLLPRHPQRLRCEPPLDLSPGRDAHLCDAFLED